MGERRLHRFSAAFRAKLKAKLPHIYVVSQPVERRRIKTEACHKILHARVRGMVAIVVVVVRTYSVLRSMYEVI